MSIKAKLSSIVAKQFPEFIREDYPTFIAFVEAYYEYLEQTNQLDILKYRDIDDTLSSFVEQFRKELASNLPNILSDKRFVIQNMRDQYLAKGTEASYRLLFRLLFGKEISIDYPSTQLLRASDGRWKQEYSIFVDVTRGTPADITGKVVQIIAPEKNIEVRVDNWRWATRYVDGIPQTSTTTAELFIDKKYFGDIKSGYVVQYGTTFEGITIPTTSNITIINPGANFNVGDLYYLKSAGGEGSLIKVIRVGTGGELLNVQFLKFGITYSSEFLTFITPTEYVPPKTPVTVTSQPSGGGVLYNINIQDEIYSLEEYGYVSVFDYAADLGTSWNSLTAYAANSYVFQDRKLYKALNTGKTSSTPPTHTSGTVTNGTLQLQYVRPYGAAWIGDYSGAILREFRTDNSQFLTDVEDLASIKVSLGAVAKYPGYYSTNLGFLDDAIYVQDSQYYQAYSYVIKIDERLKSYESVVKNLIHPAGMALFGEYELKNEFDVSVALESLIVVSKYGFIDSTDGFTDAWYLTIGKNLSETITLIESQKFTIGKLMSPETATISEALAKSVSKSVSDSYSLTDDKALTFNKSLEESFSQSDTLSYALSKVLSDSYTMTDLAVLVVTYYRTFTDNVTISEQKSLLLNKVATPDSFTLTDESYKTFTKVVTDNTPSSDLIVSIDVDKVLADTPIINDVPSFKIDYVRTMSPDSIISIDASSLLVTKPVVDNFALGDSYNVTLVKTLTETVFSSEATAFTISKSLTDSIIVTDSPNFVVSYNKQFADVIAPSDSVSKLFTMPENDYFVVTDSTPKIDPTMVFYDAVNSSESLSKLTGKGVADSISFFDATNLASDQNLIFNNFIMPTDAVSLTGTTVLTDAFYPLDSYAFSYTTQKTETATPVDAVSLNPLPAYSETSTVTDSSSMVVSKGLSETLTISEQDSYVLSTVKVDSIVLSDSSTISTSKPFTDAVSLTETNKLSIGKVTSESLVVTESVVLGFVSYKYETLSISDDKTLKIGKSFSDLPVITDLCALNNSKSVSDSALSLDSGLVEVNPYGDLSYFAEHYVSDRLTF